jgi:hypothetical protein
VDFCILRGLQLRLFEFLTSLVCATCLAHLIPDFVTIMVSGKKHIMNLHIIEVLSFICLFSRCLNSSCRLEGNGTCYSCVSSVCSKLNSENIYIYALQNSVISIKMTAFSQLTSSLQSVSFRPQCDRSPYVKILR